MKFIINHLGRFIVVAIVAALVLAFIPGVFLPSMQNLMSDVFVGEKNYIDTTAGLAPPVLSCSSEKVVLAVGDTVDLFSNITAKSSSGENLISQLSNDYAKDLAARKQVFVYRTNFNGANSLASEIDTSEAGKWVVIYLLYDGAEHAILKVPYVVK